MKFILNNGISLKSNTERDEAELLASLDDILDESSETLRERIERKQLAVESRIR
jgi:hypothetical protein